MYKRHLNYDSAAQNLFEISSTTSRVQNIYTACIKSSILLIVKFSIYMNNSSLGQHFSIAIPTTQMSEMYTQPKFNPPMEFVPSTPVCEPPVAVQQPREPGPSTSSSSDLYKTFYNDVSKCCNAFGKCCSEIEGGDCNC
jgi:hypothetical protein